MINIQDVKIYFAHPYTTHGNPGQNIKNVEELIKAAIEKYPNIIPISPLHAFSFANDLVDYDRAMEYCYTLLDDSDAMCLCGEWKKSTGVNREFERSMQKDITAFEYDQLDDFMKEWNEQDDEEVYGKSL